MHQLKPPKVQGTEVNYELHLLEWKAFQNLCITATGEVWGQVAQSFSDSCHGDGCACPSLGRDASGPG